MDIRDKVAEALRSGKQARIDAAVADWLQGISTDEELAEVYERDRESYETGPVGAGKGAGRDR